MAKPAGMRKPDRVSEPAHMRETGNRPPTEM